MKTILTVQHTEAEHHLSGHCGSLLLEFLWISTLKADIVFTIIFIYKSVNI